MKHLHSSAAFEMSARPPLLVRSEYFKADSGELLHYVDDIFRAAVPPEGWESYAQAWPDAQAAIDKMNADFATDQAIREMIAVTRADLPVGGEVVLPPDEGSGYAQPTESAMQ